MRLICSSNNGAHNAGFITTVLEQMLQSLLVCIPLLGAAVMGTASMGLIYVYVIAFDFLKCVGHSNFEFVPTWLHNLPGAKYLVYTPSYVSSVHYYFQLSRISLIVSAENCNCRKFYFLG